MKKCRKCGVEKELGDFYFEKGRPRAQCKACHKAGVYARRAANPERAKEIEKRYLRKNRDKILASSRRRWKERAPEYNALRREERAKNPEKYVEQGRRNWARHKDRINANRRADWATSSVRPAQMKAYRKRNPERVRRWERTKRKRHADRIQAYMARYYEENKELWVAHRRKREARKAAVEWQPYTRREIYDRDGGECKACGKSLPYEPRAFHLDHIVPISLGGPDTPANLQLMCPGCNRAKWANLEGQIHLPV